MLNFIKKYWFTIIMAFFILLYITIFILVWFSPKSDKLERGFIPCTKQLTSNILHNKEQSSLNLAKIIIENTYCDAKVVFRGFTNWINGKQKKPWSNYFFEPVYEKQTTHEDEELISFYKENPFLSKDMEELNKKRIILEQQLHNLDVLEESKITKPFEYDVQSEINEIKEIENEQTAEPSK